MPTIFAGPIFTEWYWGPIFILIPTLLTVAFGTSLVYAIVSLSTAYRTKSKTLSMSSRRVVVVAFLLLSIISVLYYSGTLI